MHAFLVSGMANCWCVAVVEFELFYSPRYLMYYWPITTGLYVICNMVFMKFLMSLLLWYLGSLAVQDREPVDDLDENIPDGQWQQPQRTTLDGHWTAVESLYPHGQNSVHLRPRFDLGDRDVPLDGSPVGPQREESGSSTSGSQQMHRASSSASLTQLLAAQAARDSPEPVIPRSRSTSSLLHSHSHTRASHGLLHDGYGGVLFLQPVHVLLLGDRELDDDTGSPSNTSLEPTAGFLRHRARLSETA